MKGPGWGWWLVAGMGLWSAIAGAQDITLNKTVTFTNLQGRRFETVQLTAADWDGVIWRDGTGGGRVCYTNLDPALLHAWGLPTNRIAIARARAGRKAAAEAQSRLIARVRAQAEATSRTKTAAEESAAAVLKDRAERKKAEAEAIETLAARIEEAKLLLRRIKAAAHDFNQANRYNSFAPTVYVKESERVKIEEAEVLLKRMKTDFTLKYGEKVR